MVLGQRIRCGARRGTNGVIGRRAVWLAVLAACAWGARATYLEGFRYAAPRGFTGDFTAAMFTADYWDGSGIFYGPIFVFERWLVDATPHVFTVEAFAVANIAFVGVAFAALVRALRLSPLGAAVVLALWLCSSRLSYSFSVVANPELLELAFIAGAVHLATRRGRREEAGEGVFLALAALTKYVPWALAGLVIVRRRWAAFAGLVACVVVVAVVTAIGQGLGPVALARGLLLPVGGDASGGSLIATHVESPQFLDVGTAIGRLQSGVALTAGERRIAVAGAVAVMVAALAMAVIAARAVRRHPMPAGREAALLAALSFGLLPILSPAAHPHTFVFLLPVWTAFVALAADGGLPRSLRLAVAAVGLLTYTATGFPEPYRLVDAVMGTGLMASWWVRDPIFATLVAFSAATTAALLVARSAAQDAAWSASVERRERPEEAGDVLAAGASAGPRIP
jgi:Glycosyltransferase family 87